VGIRLNGSTSGYSEIDAPAVAGNNTLVLPTGNGTADQTLVTDGSGALSWSDRGRMTLATAQNSTSGTNIDFTGIPSWVKRVTVMFNGVSTSGTSGISLQLGDSGGIETTGYAVGTSNAATSTSEFPLTGGSGAAAGLYHGSISLSLLGSNTWIVFGVIARSDTSAAFSIGGSKSLSDTLTQLRLKGGNGTDTFDAGSINILYEG
jgi:hypothetical protein